MKQGPLTDKELQWLDDILEQYANDHSVIDVSELDGFLTAILSVPNALEPEQWLVAVWGGPAQIPRWKTTRESDRFMDLTFQHMADIEERLINYPEQFAPLLGEQDIEDETFMVIDDWCYGYLRGVNLAGLPPIGEGQQAAFDLISLHGSEQRVAEVDQLTAEQFAEHQQALPAAVLALHQHWFCQPSASNTQPIVVSDKVGRNQCCPCGSGKKYKQCCLH